MSFFNYPILAIFVVKHTKLLVFLAMQHKLFDQDQIDSGAHTGVALHFRRGSFASQSSMVKQKISNQLVMWFSDEEALGSRCCVVLPSGDHGCRSVMGFQDLCDPLLMSVTKKAHIRADDIPAHCGCASSKEYC